MSRKPDDWMPLNITKYLGDTTHLTRDQHGAYLMLLMAYWMRGGPLPAHDGQLAAIVKATRAEWRRLRPVIVEFFTVSNGVWTQKRAEEELGNARRIMETKVNAGRAGGIAARGKSGRKKNSKSNSGEIADEIANPIASELQKNTPYTKNQEHSSSLRSELNAQALPAWIPGDAWDSFVEMRRKLRAPLTKKAEEIAVSELKKLRDEGNDPRAVLEQSTMKSWRGLFPVKHETRNAAVVNADEVAQREIVARKPSESRERFLVRRFKETGLWVATDGAPPDALDNAMPRDVLREFGFTQKEEFERKLAQERANCSTTENRRIA